MKTGIEDFLQNIDNSFKGKGQNEIYMTYALIFGALFAISYLLFWESSEAEFNASNDRVIAIEKKILNDDKYLQRNPVTKIASLSREIASAKKGTIRFQENNAYIKDKIESIAELVYDEVAWGKYLHSVSISAKKHKVKIIDFTNTLAPPSDKFGYMLDINIKTSSNYKNLLNFINELEKSDLVVDLHHFELKASNGEKDQPRKKLMSDLKISVWGLTY